MSRITLKTRFALCVAGLSLVILLLTLSSLWAVNLLDSELRRVAKVDLTRLELIADVQNNLLKLTSLHKDELLSSILSDTAGLQSAQHSVAESEAHLRTAITNLTTVLESAHDREILSDLQKRLSAAEQTSLQINQLITTQQMTEAIKQANEQLLPAYQQILRQSDVFRAEQRHQREASMEAARQVAVNSRFLLFGFTGLTLAATALLIVLFRGMTRALTRVALEVAHGAERVSSAALEVSSASRSLAQGASEQAASLEQTSASAEEINAMVQQNAHNSEQTATLATTAEKLLNEANLKLSQMLVSMKDISDSSEKISKIIRVIDEIAFQTNMLSLNAAVEAARAGEAGMGFAVVADEVRNLAQRCSQAARDTSALIEESISHSRTGKLRVDEVAGAMRQVTENSSIVGRLSQDVSSSSSEQARGIEQISKAISEIQMVTQKNASNAEQSTSTGNLMTEEAQHLREAAGQFRALLGLKMEAVFS